MLDELENSLSVAGRSTLGNAHLPRAAPAGVKVSAGVSLDGGEEDGRPKAGHAHEGSSI